MFVLKAPIRLYGRKLTTDLALRSGLPDAKSFSPYEGQSAYVDRLWTEETFASKEWLFEQQADFDSNVKQPHLLIYDESEEEQYGRDDMPYDPATDKLSFSKYLRRLEDIPGEYVVAYLGNVVYSICRHTGGVKEFNYSHAVAPTIKDLEDGTAIDLAELETDVNKNAWSDSEVKTALNQLPYVLRRFLNLSIYTGVHVLSLVCSYMIAAEKNRIARYNGSTKILKKNAVIAENVWTCDNQGNAVKKVEISNKNLRVYELFDWLDGESTKYVTYQEDVTNFMHYVKVLNIDIAEDMSKYGADFVRSLVVVNLTPNKQYNPQIYTALMKGTTVEMKSIDALARTMSNFREVQTSNDTVRKVVDKFDYAQKEKNFDLAKQLHYAYNMTLGACLENVRYEFIDGFLYCNGELAIISSGLITNKMFVDTRVIISELGYCVSVTDTLIMKLMPIGVAYDNMMIKLTKNTEDKLTDWWAISL